MGFKVGTDGEWLEFTGGLRNLMASIKRAYNATAVKKGLFATRRLVAFEDYATCVALLLYEMFHNGAASARDEQSVAFVSEMESYVAVNADGTTSFKVLDFLDWWAEHFERLHEAQRILEDSAFRADVITYINTHGHKRR